MGHLSLTPHGRTFSSQPQLPGSYLTEGLPSNQVLLIGREWSGPAANPFLPSVWLTFKVSVWWEYLHLIGSFGKLKTFQDPWQCMGHFSNQEKMGGVYSRQPSHQAREQQDQAIWCVCTQASDGVSSDVIDSFECSFFHHSFSTHCVRCFAEIQRRLKHVLSPLGVHRVGLETLAFVHKMETYGQDRKSV